MSALMNLNLRTFIDVAVKWFIRFIRTVSYLVANEMIVNALAVVTSELTRCASVVLLLATNLVRVVAAIVFSVYNSKAGH